MRVSWGYKLALFALFAAFYWVFYIYPNFHPKWPPQPLPLLWIDYAVPLIPWTFLIYISDYLLFASVLFLLTDLESFNSYARMVFATLMICGIFFIFLPTTYPRPPYPHSDSAIVSMVMNLISTADTPNNCFPSMHVAQTGIATWAVRRLGWKTFSSFGFWAVAIFISTLTTKQHYFVDILGGLSVMITVASLEWLIFEKRYLRDWISRVLHSM